MIVPIVLALAMVGKPAGASAVEGDGSRWTILPDTEAGSLFRQCSRSSPGSDVTVWSPTVADVERIERELPEFLRSSGHETVAREIDAYFRQYLGFVRGGVRYVYMNAYAVEAFESSVRVCEELARSGKVERCRERGYWRHATISVCDGGPSFWGVEFNSNTGKFENLDFNGP